MSNKKEIQYPIYSQGEGPYLTLAPPINHLIINSLSGEEIIRIELDTGNIFVKGKLAENDKEVVEGMKDLLTGYRCGCGGIKA